MKKTSRIDAVLVELVIVILFFALASIIVIQLFAASYTQENKSAAETKLINVIESQLATMERDGAITDTEKYFDEQAGETTRDKAFYTEKINIKNQDNLPLVDVKLDVVDKDGNSVIEINTTFDSKGGALWEIIDRNSA